MFIRGANIIACFSLHPDNRTWISCYTYIHTYLGVDQNRSSIFSSAMHMEFTTVRRKFSPYQRGSRWKTERKKKRFYANVIYPTASVWTRQVRALSIGSDSLWQAQICLDFSNSIISRGGGGPEDVANSTFWTVIHIHRPDDSDRIKHHPGSSTSQFICTYINTFDM